MPSFLSILIAGVVALLAVLYAFLQASTGEVPFNPPAHMTQLQDKANTPKQLHDGSGYTFGKFRTAVANPNLRDMNVLERTFQRKEWSFNAVSDGRWLVGFAAADLGYVQSGFLYFFDTKSGVKIASSDVQDGACSKFSIPFSTMHLEACFHANINGWRLEARAKTRINFKVALQVDMVRSGGAELALNYPIGPDRAGYTHKTAGLAVNGTLTFVGHGRAAALTQLNAPFLGVGLADYTRSQSRRFTEWFWMALTFTTPRASSPSSSGEVARHGLQFSTNIVGELESVVWIDGQMYEVLSPLTVAFMNTSSNQSTELRPGQVELAPSPHCKYVISSADGAVALEFSPRGVLPNKLRTPLVHGAFYHSYGLYRGTVGVPGAPILRIEKSVAGVFEDHSVHW